MRRSIFWRSTESGAAVESAAINMQAKLIQMVLIAWIPPPSCKREVRALLQSRLNYQHRLIAHAHQPRPRETLIRPGPRKRIARPPKKYNAFSSSAQPPCSVTLNTLSARVKYTAIAIVNATASPENLVKKPIRTRT